MKIQQGTKIRWTSAAGVLTGVVKAIKLDMNAADEVCPWIVLQDVVNESNGLTHSNLTMNANNGYLKMMNVEVL